MSTNALRIFSLKWRTLLATAAMLLAVNVSAGEQHAGYGTTKIAAMEQANQIAKEGAKKKKTCWKAARIEDCKQDSDGYWTAYADSANHQGSCGRDGYRAP